MKLTWIIIWILFLCFIKNFNFIQKNEKINLRLIINELKKFIIQNY